MPKDRHHSFHVTHVVGARPNFMKAAPIVDALAARSVAQSLIHTGQHYDELMSDVFFRDLGLPEPVVNLAVGSGTHAQQTASLISGLEGALESDRPDALVVYGDVNSTLAAAIVAVKIGLPVIHVEAGLRSFDETMPEEINRRITDQVSNLMLVTSPEAIGNLAREGRPISKIRFVGNTMIDTLEKNRPRFDPKAVQAELGLNDEWALVTLHRPANVDSRKRASELVEALNDVSGLLQLVIPLHPRGREALVSAGLRESDAVRIVPPQSYLSFVSLALGARVVITDSGGVQEETTMLGTPCLTVRPNTERPITISHGTNRLVEVEELFATASDVLANAITVPARRPPLWDGTAGLRCADEIISFLEDSTEGASR